MPPGGTLVINSDSDFLSKGNIDRDLNVIECGTDPKCDYYVHDIHDRGVDGVSFVLTAPTFEVLIDLPVPGAHNAVNAALAAAAATASGATPENIKAGLSHLRLTGKRLLVKEGNGIKVIDDSYNAAPASMRSAIDTLMNTEGARHVALLAGMNELGEKSEEYHEEVGRYARNRKVDVLIGIGEKARAIVEAASSDDTYAVWFPEKDAFYEEMNELIKPGDTVLIKGSNAYRMSEAADRLLEPGRK
jgi:UDP-N-acetylmuramoyl-tripeptide--D-alanyl-D-alanine ligase